MSRPLVLLRSLVFAPLLACAGGPGPAVGVVEPGVVEPGAAAGPSVVVESSVPTTVFLETAGMSLTPPSTCDDVVAERALDNLYDEEGAAVRPACESACRVDTCASLLVSAEVRSTAWDSMGLASVRSELAHVCEASVEGCVGVVGVVMRGEDLDTIGLVAAVDDGEIIGEDEYADEDDDGDDYDGSMTELAPMPADERERLGTACEAGDARACFSLVELPVLFYMTSWDQVRYQASMSAFGRACALEPRVYCRPLQLMIDDTTHDCSG